MAGVELGTAYISLIVEGSKVAPGVRKAMGAADPEATRAGDRAGKTFTSRFGSSLKIGTALAGAFAVTKGVQFLGDAIEEAREASVVTARTSNVIKSMGGQAKVTAKEVAELAGALSNKAGIDDEAIQSGQNLLLTFGNLRNEAGKGNDIFSQTSALMVDMSVAMDQDMKSSAVQLGKALNDPIKGITALSRVGVSFSEQQKKQIENAVEQNRVLDAQKIILGEVRKQFGGAGKAMATPADRAKVAWGNLKEQLGTELLPVVNDISSWAADKGIPAVAGFFDEFKKGKGAGGEVREIVEDVADAAKKAAGYAGDFVGWFRDMPGWAQKAMAGGAAAAFLAPKIPGSSALSKGLGSALGKAVGGGVQKVFETNPAALGGGIGGPGGTPGKGKFPWLAPVGGAATGGTIAAIIAGLGTAGVIKLQQSAAPKAADKGIAGTPNFGSGLKFDDLDSLSDKADEATKSLRGLLNNDWFAGITNGLFDVRVQSAAALDKLVGFGGQVDAVDKRKPRVQFEFPNLDRGFKDTEGLIGKIDVTDRKKPTVPFQFPGLEPGIKDTGKLGGDVDRVGKKKPAINWQFPGLLKGITDGLRLDNVLDEAAKDRTSIITVITNRRGGVTSSAGGRSVDGGLASGGPAYAGNVYRVGEVGPELFVPNVSGRVVPSNQRALVGTGRGGRMALTITNWHDGTGYIEEIADDQVRGRLEIEAMRSRAGLNARRRTGG